MIGPAFLAVRAKLRSFASPVVAVALALFGCQFLTYVAITWDPSYYGDFGFSFGYDSLNSVGKVVAGSAADRAGLKAGDIVLAPRTLRERLILANYNTGTLPRAGETVTISTLRRGVLRTVTLQAQAVRPLHVGDRILLFLQCAWLFIFLSVALILTLLRPSKMTWGFYLFSLNLALVFGPGPLAITYAPVGWIIATMIGHDLIAPAGVAGFVIFCVRFPSNSVYGWRKTIELLMPFAAAITAGWLLYEDVHGISFAPWDAVAQYYPSSAFLTMWLVGMLALLRRYAGATGQERQEIRWVCAFFALAIVGDVYDLLLKKVDDWWSIFAVFALGGVVFAITYLGAHGVKRYKIKWVALGFGGALAATASDFYWGQLGYGSMSPSTVWYMYVLELLYLALPLTVTYAIIRHRVIDIRFAVTRTFTFTILASIIGLLFAGIDWLFSTRLPSSRFEGAVYAGLALLIGFSLNAGRQRIGKTIDFVFFRQWYRAQAQAETIVDTMSHAASKAELYEPLTTGIANAFSLASTALFERVEDGGYVRVAACGWPPGMTWHILPDDPLAVRADKNSRVLDIDTLVWKETDLPAGVARPSTLFPIVCAKRVVAILLCGAHENGTALDPDEIRTIRRFCTDAGLVYGKPFRVHAGSLAAIEQGQPLSV